jgi:hypothetical protein
MIIDYISNFGNAVQLCEDFEKTVTNIFFSKGAEKESQQDFCVDSYYREILWPIKACAELFRILCPHYLQEHEPFFIEELQSLEDYDDINELSEFRSRVRMIKMPFKAAEGEMRALSSAFDSEEAHRMNEAIHNHFEGCMYSCVAMSVSATESRLLKLMSLANPKFKQELGKKTLGQLIFEYSQNEEKYSSVVPHKHKPLLDLCNTYRTFSVHPQKGRLKRPVVNSIFYLSLEFLTDRDTRPEVVQAQVIVEEAREKE